MESPIFGTVGVFTGFEEEAEPLFEDVDAEDAGLTKAFCKVA